MPRGIRNWTYRDVEKFLKKNGFRLHHMRGSHRYFVGHIEKKLRIITVPFHGKNTSIKPRTMSAIITQSGIEKKKWLGE